MVEFCMILGRLCFIILCFSTPTLGNIKLSQLSKSPTDPLTYTLIKSPKNIKVKESIYLGNRQFWDTLPFNENENLVTIRDEL